MRIGCQLYLYNISIIVSADISSAKEGDIVVFGIYDDVPIEWDVLDVDDDRVLLISHYILTDGKFNYERMEINWEDCDLREWLNGEFYDTCFNSFEKGRIETVTNDNSNSEEFFKEYFPTVKYNNSNDCRDTKDKVFLLSIDEFMEYYGVEKDGNTLYSNAASATRRNGNGWGWWLRTNSYNGDGVIYMGYEHIEESSYVSNTTGVRPVISVSK